MKFKLFLTIVILTTIHQSFSVTPDEQQNLNNQLLNAASEGNEAEVASLLQAGFQVNAKDECGVNALHKAAYIGHTATVELLLSKGADVNAKDIVGWTPLHWAAYKDRKAIIELLLSHGADSNAKNIYGSTPLHFAAYNAAYNGETAIVELLKAYQALLEQAKKPTKVLLKVAIEHGYYGLVHLLLQKGVKPDVSDLQLAKAKWHAAEHKKSYEVIGRLLVTYLQLMGELKAPENSENVHFITLFKRFTAYFRLSKLEDSIQGPISKIGIGLPESIAQEIAKNL